MKNNILKYIPTSESFSRWIKKKKKAFKISKFFSLTKVASLKGNFFQSQRARILHSHYTWNRKKFYLQNHEIFSSIIFIRITHNNHSQQLKKGKCLSLYFLAIKVDYSKIKERGKFRFYNRGFLRSFPAIIPYFSLIGISQKRLDRMFLYPHIYWSNKGALIEIPKLS